MNFKDIIAGQIYAVGSDDYNRKALVIETGEFGVTRYSGRSYRGQTDKVKGAKVAYLDADGTPRYTRSDRKLVRGTPAETYVDPFDGATVTTEATEDVWEDIEVSAVEWVPSRKVVMTAADYDARAQRKADTAKAQAKALAERNELEPHIKRKLADAGLSEYLASYGEVKLSYKQLVALVASEVAKAFAVEDAHTKAVNA